MDDVTRRIAARDQNTGSQKQINNETRRIVIPGTAMSGQRGTTQRLTRVLDNWTREQAPPKPHDPASSTDTQPHDSPHGRADSASVQPREQAGPTAAHAVPSPNTSSIPISAHRMPLGNLAEGYRLPGNYVVKTTLTPHESQRAGLYLCTGPEGDVVVKVAPTEYSPRQDVWDLLPRLDHPNVLCTYRTFEHDWLYFEVQEYCSGGSLANKIVRDGDSFKTVKPEWVMRTLVPQVHEALKYLHGMDIVHRDLKPSNIYVKMGRNGEEQLVVGDFDVSSLLERSRTSRDTQRIAGTWAYAAPEAYPRFVDEQATGLRGRVTRFADYYSLGVTIVELLQGTTSLHMCDFPDLFDFYLQGNTIAIPQDIPARLTELLGGLLIRNRHARWGADEIGRWLEGRTTDEDRRRIWDDRAYSIPHANRPYKLDNLSPVDLPGLAEAMWQKQDTATQDLMGGDVLLNWVGAIDANKARALRAVREKHRKNPSQALFEAVMICDPTRPYFMGKSEIRTAAEWFRLVSEPENRLGNPLADAALARLEAYFRLRNEPDPSMADQIASLGKLPQAQRFMNAAFMVDKNRPYAVARGKYARTAEEIATITYGSPEDWKSGVPAVYESSFQQWSKGYLYAWMSQRGLSHLVDSALKVAESLPDKPYAVFETTIRLLHPQLPSPQVVLSLDRASAGLTVPHGESRTVQIPYHTVGAGIPFGQVRLRNPQPGLTLQDRIVETRAGVLKITLDTTAGIAVSHKFDLKLGMESGNATVSIVGALTYGATLPVWKTFFRIVLGAVTGGALMGGARYGMKLIEIRNTTFQEDMESYVGLRRLFLDTWDGDFSFAAVAIGGLVALVAGLGGWFIWTATRGED